MIRFLKRNYKDGAEIKSIIRIINSIGVIHHNHHGERITQASLRKHKALDMFYKKHSSYYNEDAYRSSLERALKLFNYSPNCEY